MKPVQAEHGRGGLSTQLCSGGGLPTRITNWRIDENGFLRVTAHVLKEGVYSYGAEESGAAEVLPGVDPVLEYIPAAEFTESAMTTLEGKPVVIRAHEWREAENTLSDGLTVGTVAGRPSVTEDGCLACDFTIYDPATIQKITSGELVEVSSGYNAQFFLEDGSFGGRHYHGRQIRLEFNHVLLLSEGEGRCGHDVRIINQTPAPLRGTNHNRREPGSGKQAEGATMPTTIKATIGNKPRSYKFENEEDAARAESMLEEEQGVNAEAVRAAMAEINELKTRLEEQTSLLEDANKKIEELLSPAAQEAMAQKVSEQKEAESAIMEAENTEEDDAEKDKFGNALSACKSLAERRACTVSRVMNKRGLKVEGWSQDAFDGAFEVLAAHAKAVARAALKAQTDSARVLNGERVPGKGGELLSNRERVLRPMKAAHNQSSAQRS